MLFKIIFVFAALAASSSATNAVKNLDGYTFENFMKDFKIKYDSSELEMRREIFQNELNRVQLHNTKNLGWTEAINKFSALTNAEKKSFLGRNKGSARANDKKLMHSKELPSDFVMKSVADLPASINWADKGVATAVKDQGYCGSCWAFASTAVIESHVALASGLLFDLSVEQMAMCAPNPNSCGGTGGCAGSTAELAFEYVSSSEGLFQEYQYSYTSYYGKNFECAIPTTSSPKATINGYVQLPANNYTALMNAIATVGPVAVSVDASAWSAYNGGEWTAKQLFGCNQVNPDIDHAVVLMGYGVENGQKYWLIRNSWSPTWGEKGYIRLARFDVDEEVCGIDVTPQDGTACAGDDEPEKVCGTCGVLFDSAYPLNAIAF